MKKFKKWLVDLLTEVPEPVEPEPDVEVLHTIPSRLTVSISRDTKNPIKSGWYLSNRNVWWYLVPDWLYISGGKILWFVHISQRNGTRDNNVGFHIVQTLLEKKQLVYLPPEEVFNTHCVSPDPGRTCCVRCGLAKNHWLTFPCRPGSEKKDSDEQFTAQKFP